MLRLLLVLLAYPIAWFVSVGLAYAFAIVGIVLGALISVKRFSKVDIVLGVILLVFSVIVLAGTISTHIAVIGVEKAIKEATKVENVTASLGEPIKVGDWRVTVLSVQKADYVKIGDSYYEPSKGKKFIIVKLRIEYLGKEMESPSEIWDFTIVTNARKGYSEELIPANILFEVSDEVKAKAVEITGLDKSQKLASGGSIEGDILFEIPTNEEPVELHFKVGIVGGYKATVSIPHSS